MATQVAMLLPGAAIFPATVFAARKLIQGSSTPVEVLAFDDTLDEAAVWRVSGGNYGSGSFTVDILFYADTASTGVVRWGASMSAITPDTDTQDVETKSLATEQTVDKTHPGTTGQRLQKASITLSNTDSAAGGDAFIFRIRRIGSNGADTLSGDALLERVYVSYSDT